MEIYNDFAKVYNKFMGDTPYEKWYKFLHDQLQKHNIKPNIVCDLGCGTGVMCEMFAHDNIEVIGIDKSQEMLMEARENSSANILYLCQDMCEFELFGTVDLIYCSCDGINYLHEEDEIIQTFKLVNNYLERGGLFIFDINTEHKYKEVLGQKIFAEQTEDAAYIWENYYDEAEKVNEFGVSFFIKEEGDKYIKKEEFHYQKAYSVDQIKSFLKQAGLELVEIFDDYSHKPCGNTTLRATFIARETYNENKFYEDKVAEDERLCD
ncbi:MAG: methyltransferase [Epulopiscium sp. Nele67-Bin004]|nr:MAG: methyltransferase [Epulopiscium sp. Nele67-Bin004]